MPLPRVPKGPTAKRKIHTVLREFKAGALRSGSGSKVTSKKQAVAIALSKARRARGGPHGRKKR